MIIGLGQLSYGGQNVLLPDGHGGFRSVGGEGVQAHKYILQTIGVLLTIPILVVVAVTISVPISSGPQCLLEGVQRSQLESEVGLVFLIVLLWGYLGHLHQLLVG